MLSGPSIVVAGVATYIFWSGARAIIRQRTVLRPRYSQESDSAHTFSGRVAVAIGIAQIILAVSMACVWFFR